MPARGRAVVKTGLQIACPPGTYARVAPRSGLAVKHFIDTGAGVVDEDYRGEVGVVLFNHSDTTFQGEAPGQAATGRNSFSSASLLAKSPRVGLAAAPLRHCCMRTRRCLPRPARPPCHAPLVPLRAVKRGDRVAQLILERIATPEVLEVQSLDDTQRGAGGYGSTGVAS